MKIAQISNSQTDLEVVRLNLGIIQIALPFAIIREPDEVKLRPKEQIPQNVGLRAVMERQSPPEVGS